MNRKIVMIVIGAVVAVLVVAAGYLLYRGISRFNSEQSALRNTKQQLNRFYRADPFPSEANIEQERANENLLNDWMDELVRQLRQGQLDPVKSTPSRFARLLGQTRSELQQMAEAARVTLPEDFGFGFERYFEEGSSLPPPEAVPRLGQQLAIISSISRMAFDAGVDMLVDVRRQEFEAPDASANEASRTGSSRSMRAGVTRASARSFSGRAGVTRGTLGQAPAANPDAGIMHAGDLFATLHFTFELTTKSDPLLALLNRLAAHEMFVVVTSIHLSKDASDVREPEGVTLPAAAAGGAELSPGAAGGEAVPSIEKPPRLQRLVSGPDIEVPMSVILDLDVYRFQGGS